MYYHLILVVKYRKKVIDEPISERLREIFLYISVKYNITLQEWNQDKDHIHILFKGHPNSELSKFINAYKSASSRLIKKRVSPHKVFLMEGQFLVQKFLLAYNRRSTSRSNPKIY